MSKRLTILEMIERAKEVHGDKYDYSLVENEGLFVKNKIICKKCGNIFEMPFNNHINQKQGCKFCSHRSYSLTTDEFIKRGREIYDNKYDYSKVKYVNKSTKVCIICPEHGEFWKTPDKHLNAKQGCPHCSKLFKLNNEIFIKRARNVHNGKYDYSKSEYKGNDVKVCIVCPKHGEFWQTPLSHMNGVGCPKCHEEHNINESALYDFLKENYKEEIIWQYKAEWLSGQTIDIYIPSKKIGIEYQGIQHFKPVRYFGGIKKYEYTITKDKEKFDKCKNNGIKLFYFSKEKELPNDYLDTIYSNNNELLREIIRYGTE